METALALVQLFNLASPAVADLVLMIRKKDGGVTIVALLDEASAQYQDNINKAQDWLALHKKA